MEACYLGSVRFRILSLVFLCLAPAFSIIIVSFVKGPELFASLGISDAQDSGMLAFFVSTPIALFFVIAWQRLVLKVHFPPLRQAFFRPRNVIKQWPMKLLVVFYLLACLIRYFEYGNSL